MRVLFTSIFGTGHILPLLPYAHEMERRGWDVRIAAPDPVAHHITGAGLTHVPVGYPTAEQEKAFWSQIDHMPPKDRVPYIFREIFVGAFPKLAYPDMYAFAKDWWPDLVVREAGEYAGAMVAAKLGVPHVRVSVSNGHTLTRSIAPFDALRTSLGLEPDNGKSLRAAHAFSVFPASMEPEDGDGALFPQFRVAPPPAAVPTGRPDWKGPDGLPQVYMTFGTVMGTSDEAKATFRAALEAVAALDVSVLMTTGSKMDVDALGEIPGNVTLREFVPQAEVLAHVDAVVCHGGSGTLLGALAAGLPVVVTPIGADQHDNASAIETCGAGVQVADADPDRIRSGLQAVLKDEGYRDSAMRIATEMAGHASVLQAVDLMQHIAGKAPVATVH